MGYELLSVNFVSLTVKNIVINLLYWSITVFALPWLILSLEKQLGVKAYLFTGSRFLAVLIGLAGVALQIRCVILFQRIGYGTPSPLFPTTTLVVSGPYSCVRNPMNLGEVMILLGFSSWFGSPGLLCYSILAWISFHLFVIIYEEPNNSKRFGSEYDQYRNRVPRWIPRFRDGL